VGAPYKPDPHVVPVTKEQLQGVLDPATALFLYARSDNPAGDLSVCHHTVPVFDGEQRFDLVLKPKRTVSLQKNASSVYSGFATVCRVKFNPISGYRTDDPDIRFISRFNEIEVWLVSLPSGHVCALSDRAADSQRSCIRNINLFENRDGR